MYQRMISKRTSWDGPDHIHKGKGKFNKFRVLLYSGCGSTILMLMLIKNLNPKEDNVIQWHTQAGNITTS